MAKTEKLIKKLLSNPADFTWDELLNILSCFGYEEMKKSGSERRFVDEEKNIIIGIHKPHGSKPLKRYQLKIVVNHLKERGKL